MIERLLSATLVISLAACSRGGEEPPASEPEMTAGEASGDSATAQGLEAAAATPTPRTAPAQPRVEQRRPEVEANRELAERLGLAPPPPLIVSDLLTRSDVRELTGFSGELLETSLQGLEPNEDYNAIRISADSGYGYALQLWQFAELRRASNKFRRLRETYFASEQEAAPIGNEAFSARFSALRHYAFLHRGSNSVAVVTCQESLCDREQIRSLSERVLNRL
ncbi:MAG: hypothetical protein ACI82G_003410 [Bradymonadia bacterium]|jgi:hypothetical protein